MALQLIPLIKVLGPYLTTIATTAIPAFTSKPAAAKADPVQAQQISELQDAVTKNAQSLHILAEQLQKVITLAEQASVTAERQIALYKALVVGSTVISVVAVIVAIYSLF
ncbi:hypothetical protein WG68_09300 [Arsukibacterium ikkense]|uniref:Methyl-accepting chemotaxis protein n=1 Tax=Arsukibacterium ikkense TaxID=336831 RepID=A0A0M2V8S5_9GAMM|nr:hypothetical protein [Arsukibacterium ikkense]KKO45573.1 hypothetical protein WG68_09300 [Arsukibacterium ikkense]